MSSNTTTKPKYNADQIAHAEAFSEFGKTEAGRYVKAWLDFHGYKGVCPFKKAEHNPTLAAEIAGKQQLIGALHNEIVAAEKIMADLAEAAGIAHPTPPETKPSHARRKQS